MRSSTTKKNSILTEKKGGSRLVCNSDITGKNIWEKKYLGEITYLGKRATLSNLTLFGRWFHVEGVSDFCFSNLWQEATKSEKRF